MPKIYHLSILGSDARTSNDMHLLIGIVTSLSTSPDMVPTNCASSTTTNHKYE